MLLLLWYTVSRGIVAYHFEYFFLLPQLPLSCLAFGEHTVQNSNAEVHHFISYPA